MITSENLRLKKLYLRMNGNNGNIVGTQWEHNKPLYINILYHMFPLFPSYKKFSLYENQ